MVLLKEHMWYKNMTTWDLKQVHTKIEMHTVTIIKRGLLPS